MTASEAIKEILKLKELNQAKLSDMLDIPLKTLNERLRHKNISVNKLDETLRVMGYKIMVVPRETKVENGFDIK
jgi:mRNA-degrading endonuclease RelE of RelBE toxin-antitoxin system|nr:MAG TPA: transcription repressor [Caudoviricetes sp.]DAI21969.1 MAG TPA: transcription repressor [Caudoviricetes sp.]DAJ70541.1 MAG TPA: transcription repressor [Caudoviricetes sp.]DAO13672.1 MAG TPA: transcription repressor [Caudoviricetes sp.]DAO32499.1 MAG TPA: transcription repressor [Caudoviricetes sp.]